MTIVQFSLNLLERGAFWLWYMTLIEIVGNWWNFQKSMVRIQQKNTSKCFFEDFFSSWIEILIRKNPKNFHRGPINLIKRPKKKQQKFKINFQKPKNWSQVNCVTILKTISKITVIRNDIKERTVSNNARNFAIWEFRKCPDFI